MAERPTVWIPDAPTDVGLDEMPPVATFSRYEPPTVPPEIAAGHLLVTPYAMRRLANETVVQLPPGVIVQALESGVDSLIPAIPSGVTLCNARGVHDGPVAEWVLAAILGSLKRLGEFRDGQREAAWRRLMPESLSGKTVLLLGYGAIGRAVESRLEPFGVKLLRASRRASRGVSPAEELPSLLPKTDVVVLLAPLTESTRGMVDERFLAALPDGALLVNAARGQLVVAEALERELRAGRLRAVLDVTDPEPLPEQHPLWSAPGLLVTPHVASDTPDVLERLYRFVHAQATRIAAGSALRNVVTSSFP